MSVSTVGQGDPTGQLAKSLQEINNQLQQISVRMDRLEQRAEASIHRPPRPTPNRGYREPEFDGYEEPPPRGRPRQNMGPEREEDRGIRVKIPPFEGKSDPDEYLEWEGVWTWLSNATPTLSYKMSVYA